MTNILCLRFSTPRGICMHGFLPTAVEDPADNPAGIPGVRKSLNVMLKICDKFSGVYTRDG